MAKPKQALVRWDEQLAKLATIATETEASVGGGAFIQTAGGILKYKGAEVPGNEMNVVVLDHILENAFYAGAFDPGNPQSPVCFAFGRAEDDMRPHEKATQPQNETCAGCPQNEWGSADVGRGKACKNIRRLAVISEGDLEDIANAEVAFVKPAVTSIKGWAGYVRKVAEQYQRPPLGVITNIKLVPDAQTQFKMVFSTVSLIEDSAQLEALIEKNQTVSKEIDFPYQFIEPAPQPVRGRKVLPARQPVAPTSRQAQVAIGKQAQGAPVKRAKF
jgi:hypothetical protein